MIEGNSDRNEDVISRLHGIIRPFVLRRLKKDVETQMPGKYEHVVKCQLSRRQVSLSYVEATLHFHAGLHHQSDSNLGFFFLERCPFMKSSSRDLQRDTP